jgi:hypothetical protein
MQFSNATNINVNNSNSCSDQRVKYESARDLYVQQRVEEMLIEQLSTFDGKGFADPITDDDDEIMKSNEEEAGVVTSVRSTANAIAMTHDSLTKKFGHFVSRREELLQVLKEIDGTTTTITATGNGSNTSSLNDDGSSSDMADDDLAVVSDEDLLQQQKELEEIQQEKIELEAQLADIGIQMKEQRRKLQDAPDNVDEEIEDGSIEKITRESNEGSDKITELQQMVEWYNAVRSAIEELGSLRVLSVEEAPAGENEEAGIYVNILLEDEYKLVIKLAPIGRDRLRVMSAVIEGDEISEAQGMVIGRMPSLDDVVAASKAMTVPEDVRFVVREASVRMRSLAARVEDIVELRKKYLLQMNKKLDELVVSVNEGVVAVVRLSEDYPLLPGCVYIAQIAGVAGWDEAELDMIRKAVNDGKWSRVGQVINLMKEEVQKGRNNSEMMMAGTPGKTMNKILKHPN